MKETDSIPTRQTLLVRLKDLGDDRSWREFFERYWRLIHAAARKAGLEESEAEEVVQEVMISAARKMPEFKYDPGKDSLKGWLLGVTRWKVADQFRKREKAGDIRKATGFESDTATSSCAGRSSASECLADSSGSDLEAVWEGEWRANLLRSALDCVKRCVNPAHYEMYHLHIVKGMSARETARALGVSTAAIHLAKFRVGRKVEGELRRLRRNL